MSFRCLSLWLPFSSETLSVFLFVDFLGGVGDTSGERVEGQAEGGPYVKTATVLADDFSPLDCPPRGCWDAILPTELINVEAKTTRYGVNFYEFF